MKKLILLILTILVTTVLINAQPPTEVPTVPGDKPVRDNNIKNRSIALERAKRELSKNSTSPVRADIDKKFPEIKEDFEGMQISQSAIIKAYTTGKNIDYNLISASSKQVNKHAKRLYKNLFTKKLKIKKKKSKDKDSEETKPIKDLIVGLDNSIGAFSQSAMFRNLRVVQPEVAEKAQKDLRNIVILSSQIEKMAGAMK